MTLRVNGEGIPEEAVLLELRRLIEYYSQHMSREDVGHHMPELVRKAKEQAVGARLLLDEATRQKIEVPEGEVEQSLAQMQKQAGGRDAFESLMARQQLTRPQLKHSIRNGKRIDRLVAKVTAQVAAPTEDEVRAYYEAHKDQYVAPDRIALRHILIKPASDSEHDRAATRSQLLGFYAEIQQGRDFAELAAAYSECPSGQQAGGNLGWVVRGQTLPAFEAAAFPLQVGEVSDVVETPLGFHLIQKAAEEEGGPLEPETALERVRDLLVHTRRGEALAAYVARLRAEVVVEDDEDDNLSDRSPDEATESFLEGEEDGGAES